MLGMLAKRVSQILKPRRLRFTGCRKDQINRYVVDPLPDHTASVADGRRPVISLQHREFFIIPRLHTKADPIDSRVGKYFNFFIRDIDRVRFHAEFAVGRWFEPGIDEFEKGLQCCRREMRRSAATHKDRLYAARLFQRAQLSSNRFQIGVDQIVPTGNQCEVTVPRNDVGRRVRVDMPQQGRSSSRSPSARS